MSEARFLVGDVFERLAEMPDASVDLVLTSPPFLALRSYLPADHPDKAKEIGSEPTPAAFLDTLLHLTAEWRRVLAPHGSICVELGDTYSGSGGAGGDYAAGGIREGQGAFEGTSKRRRKANGFAERDDTPRPPRNGRRSRAADEEAGILTPRGRPGPAGRDEMPGWPMDKSLCGIPHLYHLSLAYGRNLLTGEPSPAGSWRVRNVVAWCRPNPPVGALGDKFRPGTSYMTIATVARDRYFDLDAVRTEHKTHDAITRPRANYRRGDDDSGESTNTGGNPAGAPPLDWWEIPTQPYAGSHYATWPAALCTKPIRSMCPQRVCRVCGEPSRRIVGDTETYAAVKAERPDVGDPLRNAKGGDSQAPAALRSQGRGGLTRQTDTLGWTDCGCSDDGSHWRTGIVLDPFAGSGTTLAVATGEGRGCIGIDLDARNADLARERVGMFLDVEYPSTKGVA